MSYIFFDLDDTLLDGSASVSDYTLRVLRALQKRGHVAVIDTARSRPFQKQIFEAVRPDYAIINGGSTILDKNGEPIWERLIPKDTVGSIIPKLLSICRAISVQVGDVSYTNEPYARRADSRATDFDTFTPLAAEKLVIASTCDAELEAIAREHSLDIFSYFGGEYKRINALGAPKAQAMLALLAMNGEDISNTIAFGDDFGDIDMLLTAAHGVVMKNASSAVRERIPNVTDYTNAEDGVARYLVKYFGIEEYFPYPTTL